MQPVKQLDNRPHVLRETIFTHELTGSRKRKSQLLTPYPFPLLCGPPRIHARPTLQLLSGITHEKSCVAPVQVQKCFGFGFGRFRHGSKRGIFPLEHKPSKPTAVRLQDGFHSKQSVDDGHVAQKRFPGVSQDIQHGTRPHGCKKSRNFLNNLLKTDSRTRWEN